MLPALISEEGFHYLDSELQTLIRSNQIVEVQAISALENRACSSLCELSSNICKDEETSRKPAK
jgi:hypothetical protein